MTSVTIATEKGDIDVDLFTTDAPKASQNFIDLAKQEIPEKLVLCGTGSSFTFTA